MTSSDSAVQVLAVVPLRLASQRIPKKILADIDGQSLAARTVGKVIEALGSEPWVEILAAVDSEATQKHLESQFPNLRVMLTDPALASGTDRVFAAVQMWTNEHPARKASLRGVLNIQGDMPFAGIEGLRQAAGFYRAATDQDLARFGMLTLSQPWPREVPLEDLGSVKVIVDREHSSIYFSRYPIPYSRNPVEKKRFHDSSFELACDLHIGVYGYTLESLARVASHAPVALELAEGLEQLRALWLGIKILCLRTTPPPHASFRGIDTPKDLSWARRFAGKRITKAKAKRKPVKKNPRKKKRR